MPSNTSQVKEDWLLLQLSDTRTVTDVVATVGKYHSTWEHKGIAITLLPWLP